MGLVINCILLMLTSVVFALGVGFFLKNKGTPGYTRYYILALCVSASIWCAAYGSIGITDKLQRAAILRIFGVVSILAVVLITNVFVRPLKDVSSQMEAIANGDFNARVDIRSNDEIGQVSQSFNTMAGRLETTMEEILEREKMEHQMRYGLLIAQVDPHFIYNTMNTITYLAQKGRNEDVIIVNRAMIDILRDRLRIDINDVYDTVIQEIHVVEQYLTI